MTSFKKWLYRRKFAKKYGVKASEILIIEPSKLKPKDYQGIPLMDTPGRKTSV
jgi:hypothetical protein